MMKNFEDFPAFGKQQFDASVASATAFTKGMQNIATEVAEYSKKSFEDSAAVVEKAAAAKSLDKAFEIQSALREVSLRRLRWPDDQARRNVRLGCQGSLQAFRRPVR